MAKLVHRPEEADEKVYELAVGKIQVGRTEDNGIWLADASLSRRHAEIEVLPDRVTVRDLGSKNGTYVNGRRVEVADLRPGDTVRFGSFALMLDPSPGQARPTSIYRTGALTRASVGELIGARTRLFDFRGGSRADEQLQMLLKVSELLASPGDTSELLRKVLDLTVGVLDAEGGAVLMFDGPGGEVVPAAVRAPRGRTEERVWSQHVVDYVRHHAVAALFADAQSDVRLAAAESILDSSIRTSMCAPLRPRDDVIGVLYVDHRSVTNRFAQPDLELLTALATQAAIAIDNARLWQKLEEEAVRRETMTRFFPPATVDRILSAPSGAIPTIDTEVTALFSDISDFTSMSAAMDPVAVVDLLNGYFPAMAQVVFAHEGTLEKYIGDALLAIWGAPFSRGDDADRALEAAVEMQRTLAKLNDAWAPRHIAIHIGLNTGRVAAGNIGSSRYLQYVTVGDATNVASRVCGLAGSGEILISESTRARLSRARWPLETLAPVTVKGKTEPLVLHRVVWSD